MEELINWLGANDKVIVALTALAAVVLSFSSLVVGLISVLLERGNSLMSIRPLATIDVGDYENNIYVAITNVGVGPLRVDSLDVIRDGDVVAHSIIEAMPARLGHVVWSNFVGNISGRGIAAGTTLQLIRLTNDTMSNTEFVTARTIMRAELARLTVRLRYRDLHGKRLDPVSRSLDWFGPQRGREKKERVLATA